MDRWYILRTDTAGLHVTDNKPVQVLRIKCATGSLCPSTLGGIGRYSLSAAVRHRFPEYNPGPWYPYLWIHDGTARTATVATTHGRTAAGHRPTDGWRSPLDIRGPPSVTGCSPLVHRWLSVHYCQSVLNRSLSPTYSRLTVPYPNNRPCNQSV